MAKQSTLKKFFSKFRINLNNSPDKHILHKSSGIEIRFVLDENTFPDNWLNIKVRPKVDLIHKNEISRSALVVSKAMNKYPDDFLQKNLSAVYVFKVMSFHGHLYGGTHDFDKIYLSNGGMIQGFTDNQIESTFHHEMSSILFVNYQNYFRKKAWKDLNRKAYQFQDSVDALLNHKVGEAYLPTLNEQGFLHEFASTTIRNDFVSIAENIFLGDSTFFETIKTYPALEKKCELMIQFFYMVDERFTPEYFKKLRGL